MPVPLLRSVLAATLVLAGAAAPAHAAAPNAVTVDVDVRAGLATVPATAIGVNHAIWDAELGTDTVADLLGDAGVRMVRYPGGSYADIYHWRDHTAPGGYVAPNTDFDTFMAGARRTGAEPMIIANYGTGTAQEAADWVRYANVTKGYDATYWTIGNENYGNGHYGAAWEADEHADKSPREYASHVVAYSRAMKAVDPTIKVGAVLTMPGNWPDGIVAEGDTGTWNKEVLSNAGDDIDFVDVHWYPGKNTDVDQAEDAMFLLRQQIDAYGEPGTAISLTEINAATGPNTQPGALFLADVYTGLLEQGVFTVQWWNVHNGIGTVTEQAGQRDYGDFGLLSSGGCTADGTVCEPPMNTPFAPYHALTMVGAFARPGDQLVRAGTNDPLVSAHAARRPDGSLAVLLVNKDPDNARPITLSHHGWTPSAAAPVATTFTNGATGITTGSASVLPAYSITLLTLQPARAEAGPPAPDGLTVSDLTDRTATLSWTGRPGAKFEVYRQRGGASELWGETTGTRLTARNLEPGRRYTVNVVARDSAGRLSRPSRPLTFTTPAPATSTCAVTLNRGTDWGNGFVWNLDVTGPAAANWTLTFDWPTRWQTMTGGWNATWEQTGRTVRVTGSGLPTTVGFTGSYSGPNVPPTVFNLNGTVCTTN